MKEWLTPILVVAGIVALGFGIRALIVKRSAASADDAAQATDGAEGARGPNGEPREGDSPPPPDRPREEFETGEGWEERNHPFIGYPAEPAPREAVMRAGPPGRATEAPGTMVSIPAGDVTIGSDDLPFAAPAHRVHVKAFRMDRYEVTSREYKEFVDATEHRQPALKDEWAADYSWRENTYPPGTGSHPVTLVDLRDARTYCAWKGKRLPTEAEWEKAARGEEARTYPWGNDWDGRRSHTTERLTGPMSTEADWQRFLSGEVDEQHILPSDIGGYPEDVSPYGNFDMHGNVAEWVDAEFKAYDGGKPGETELFTQANIGVVRGASYASRDYAAPSAARFPYPVAHQDSSIGFRCASDP